ncbi:MAG: hypothetical protein HUJ26_14260 [Planctomycetaceae bacterium]|nr:hypothetical protein [Planctomycetaceae bacterium]
MMNSWMTRIAALTVCLSLPALLLAGPPEDKPEKPEKVLVAHLAEEIEEFDEETGELTGTTYLYVVISVSERSLDAHLGHGDAIDGGELIDGSTWSETEKGDMFEIVVEAADPMAP